MSKLKYVNLFVALYVLGVIDQIHDKEVRVELTGSIEAFGTSHLPLWMFPCEISEGDMFYFTKEDGLLELRCGEPPPG